jgi:hypothetical protein
MEAMMWSRGILLSAAAIALAACGGGGSGGINPISAPPPTPAPASSPPPPPTQPPIPPGAIGLQSAAPFQAYSANDAGNGKLGTAIDAVKFSYSASDNRYTITLPGFEPGQLLTKGGSGSFDAGSNVWSELRSTWNAVTVGTTNDVQPVFVSLAWAPSSGLKYTGAGSWYSAGTSYPPTGVFAYGIPTLAGDVPIAGSATYAGQLSGLTSDAFEVWGSVALSFDFGAGTLSGAMKPEIAPVWDAVSLGDYKFRDTVFSKGSTSFSGAFEVSGSSAPSSFHGSFNGPQAAELMANWNAPYLNPANGKWSTMAGIWTAKKP